MKITIKKDVFVKLPKFQVGFIVLRGIYNRQRYEESVDLLQKITKLVQLEFNKETYKSHALISPWAAVQQEYGAAAKHYHTNVEKLMLQVLHKKKVVANDTMTNLLRFLSLKNIMPMSIDDMDKIIGDIYFGVAGKKERRKVLSTLKPGQIYYEDKKDVLGVKLNYWKNPRTRVQKTSKNILMHIDALPPVTEKKLREILRESALVLETFFGVKTKVVILSKKKNEMRISD